MPNALLRGLRSLPMPETAIALVAFVALVAVAVLRDTAARGTAALPSYSSYEYDGGGYRGLYEVLARVGVRVERFERRPAFLGNDVDTLVWIDPPSDDPRQTEMGKADVSALEAWVRAGGAFVYAGEDDAAARNGILHLPRLRTAHAQRGAHAFVAPELARLGIARISSAATRRWQTRRDTRVLVDDGRGPLVVTYRLGRGRVSVVSDRDLFSNARLLRGDRPRLAVALASPQHRAGVVAFDEAVHGHLVPMHWWNVIPRSVAAVLALAAVALSIAFAGAAMRLGPPLIPAPGDDRDGSAFLSALASLLARGRAETATFAEAVTSTTRALARRFGLPPDAPDAAVAAHLDAPEDRVAYMTIATTARSASVDASRFVRGIALAQRLRKDSIAHGRPRH